MYINAHGASPTFQAECEAAWLVTTARNGFFASGETDLFAHGQ
jgi:hypothetical protein